jgi:outer membrane protein OmpA-like peptidoglycan-associated protein
MKLLTLLFLIINFASFAQLKLSGEWQGILVENNLSWKDGKPIYLTISVINGLIDGKIREEIYNSNSFSVLKVSGKTTTANSIELSEDRVLKQTEKVTNPCLRQLKLVYKEDSGYFEGVFESIKCSNSTGKIILYKSKFEFHDKNETLMNHSWFLRFNADLENGLSSPTKRLDELKAFKFESVYFDYGKDILKEEYKSYLLKMIKMVKSHSDLRIKITGHTDADGSETYNDKLSKKRTETIIRFFEENGLKRDRIVTDYKGEKKPVDSNKTEDGKRKNRRVDFEFI